MKNFFQKIIVKNFPNMGKEIVNQMQEAERFPIQDKPKEKHTAAAAAKTLQLCPTLCDPIDGSPPGSPVPGILQARTLGWVAISFSSA